MLFVVIILIGLSIFVIVKSLKNLDAPKNSYTPPLPSKIERKNNYEQETNEADLRIKGKTNSDGTITFTAESNDPQIKKMAEFLITTFTNSKGNFRNNKFKSPKEAIIKYYGTLIEPEVVFKDEELKPKERFVYFMNNLNEFDVEYNFLVNGFKEFFIRIPKELFGEYSFFYKKADLLENILSNLENLLYGEDIIFLFSPEVNELVNQGYFNKIKIEPNAPGFQKVLKMNFNQYRADELKKMASLIDTNFKPKTKSEAENFLRNNEDFYQRLEYPLTVTNKFFNFLDHLFTIVKNDLEKSSKFYPENFKIKEEFFDIAEEEIGISELKELLANKEKIKYREKLFIEKESA